MNRLVLALAVVALAGLIVSGVSRDADAQDGTDIDDDTVRVVDLENRVADMEADAAFALAMVTDLYTRAYPLADPNLLGFNPGARAAQISTGPYSFQLSCRLSDSGGGFTYDLTCARVGEVNEAPFHTPSVPQACFPFNTQETAQMLLDRLNAMGRGDTVTLDEDGDGIACEHLP